MAERVGEGREEERRICGECGAPMDRGILQPDGSTRFVYTGNSEHIFFLNP
jgi:hypothetical protein